MIRSIWLRFIGSCRESTLLASRALDGRLPVGTRLRLFAHHLSCKACQAYARQLKQIRHLIRNGPDPADSVSVHLTDDQKQAMKNHLKSNT